MTKAKEIAGLDCAMRATDGISLILRSRLEEMCSFRAAALEWSDIEGVHDMRVASRRLRSAIKDFLPYLRRRKLRQAREDLRRVAHLLGAVRDQDVALSALEKLAAEAPSVVSPGIEQFASNRQRKQQRARSRLEEALTVDSLQKLRMEFHDTLEESSKALRTRAGSKDGQETTDEAPLSQVAREIIDERLRDLQGLSASLFQPFATEPLHQMRIAAKRLRYAIELFTPCLSEEIKSFCKEIAKMQDSLGELHDCDVWIAEIGAALIEAPEDNVDREAPGDGAKGGDPVGDGAAHEGGMPVARAALFWLLDHFVKERTGHFRDALERWREWTATGFQEQLVATLHHQSPAAESSAQTPSRATAVSGITAPEH